MEDYFWPSLLLMLGLGLLVAEVFLPTGGMVGLLAGACLVGSGYLAWRQVGSLGLRWIALEVTLMPMAWVGSLYGLPRTRLGRRVYLQPPTDADLETTRGPLGRVGLPCRALTPLRPSGSVELEGRRVEAMAESGLIDAGTSGRVVAVRSGRVIVRAD